MWKTSRRGINKENWDLIKYIDEEPGKLHKT